MSSDADPSPGVLHMLCKLSPDPLPNPVDVYGPPTPLNSGIGGSPELCRGKSTTYTIKLIKTEVSSI